MWRLPKGRHVFERRCRDADEMILCCDCLGWFPMQRVDEERWKLELNLPEGRHHLRCYVRKGTATIRFDEQDLQVGEAPAPPKGAEARCRGDAEQDQAG